MSKNTVTFGDSVTTNAPVTRLQNEKDVHVVPPLKLLFPSALKPSSEVHQLCGASHGDAWIEIGASAYSIMPYSIGYGTYIVFDRRPWVQKILLRSHSPVVRETYIALTAFFSDPPEALTLRELCRLATPLETDEQIGTAFFILSRTGGTSARIPYFDRAIDCSNRPDEPAKIMQRHALLIPQTLPVNYDDEKMIRDVFKIIHDSDLESFHLNINFTIEHPGA